MRHEFNNRIEAQRIILQALNAKGWRTEDLSGLSAKAIERWVAANGLDRNSVLVSLAMKAGDKLFFLANKSQEQISDEYKLAVQDIASIRDAIEVEIAA